MNLPNKHTFFRNVPDAIICVVKNKSTFPRRTSVLQNYLSRQIDDEFARLAREHSYRARSAFKLIEINDRYKIVRKGSSVLDFGSAPGSWCQVLSDIVFENGSASDGYILGVDLQPILPIYGVDLLCNADLTKQATQAEIVRRSCGRCFNAVLSDVAPSPTGDRKLDHERIVHLCSEILNFITTPSIDRPLLAYNGSFLCKLWAGSLRDSFMTLMRGKNFKSVRILKPEASRDDSAEIYILGTGFSPAQIIKSKLA